MKISIITFILILTFCATGFSQSAFSLELRYEPTVRTFEWNKLEKSPFSDELHYPNGRGLLVNYRISKKERHFIKTGLIVDKITFSFAPQEVNHPETLEIIYTDGSFKHYYYNIPLYYSLLIKGFYVEVGGQLEEEAMTKIYFGDDLVNKEFRFKYFTSFFEYHFGIGYQKTFGRIGVKVNIALDSPLNLKHPYYKTYYEYGINLGLLYQFK